MNLREAATYQALAGVAELPTLGQVENAEAIAERFADAVERWIGEVDPGHVRQVAEAVGADGLALLQATIEIWWRVFLDGYLAGWGHGIDRLQTPRSHVLVAQAPNGASASRLGDKT